MSHTLAARNPVSHHKHANHRTCTALCSHGSRSRASWRSLCSEWQFWRMSRRTRIRKNVSHSGVLPNEVCETGGARPTCQQTVREKWGKTGGSSFATGAKLSGRTHPEGPIARIFTRVLRHWQRRAGESAVSGGRRREAEDASRGGRTLKVAPARRRERRFQEAYDRRAECLAFWASKKKRSATMRRSFAEAVCEVSTQRAVNCRPGGLKKRLQIARRIGSRTFRTG